MDSDSEIASDTLQGTDEPLGRGLRKEGEIKVVEINVFFLKNLKVRQTNPALFSMAWSDRFFCELFILQI